MKLSEKQRNDYVRELATNCAAWKGDEDTLNDMSDERLDALHKQHEEAVENTLVANMLLEGLDVPDDMTANELPAFLKKKLKGKGKPADEEGEEDDDEEEEEPTKNSEGVVLNALRTGKRLTKKQFDAIAPAEVLERDKLAQRVLNREKGKIVERLTANIGDPKKRAAKTQVFMNRDYESLAEMAELLPPTTNTERDDEEDAPVFLLGGGGRRRSSLMAINEEQAEEDVRDMTMPTLNIAPISDRKDRKRERERETA